MMLRVSVVVVFFSALFFPWPFTAGVAIVAAFFEPLIPLVAGIFIDTLYFVPHGVSLPLFTLLGTLGTAIAFFVHSRLKTSSIER